MKFILVRRDILDILFLIVYENPLGCLVAQGNVSFGCFQKDGAFVGFFFLDFDFHVNVDTPALEVVHEAVVFHDTADVGGISYFQISQPLAGDTQTAAVFSGDGISVGAVGGVVQVGFQFFRKNIIGLVFQSFRHFMGLAPGEMEVVYQEYFPQGMVAEQAACFFPAFSRHLASLIGCIVHISLFLQFCDHLTHRRRGDLEGLRKFLICDNIMVFAEQIYCL